jgi:hypothetical protein
MIKIDMEMPESCIRCENCIFEVGRLYCQKTNKIVSLHYGNSIDDMCPLIECEDENI